MKTATYTNRHLNQVTTMNVLGLKNAWDVVPNVCLRMGWNVNMFANNVKITLN